MSLEVWKEGMKEAFSDIREDTRQRDFRIIAGTAFLTFAYLGRNWYVDKGPFKTVTKVLAGTLLTTIITYYILLPVLGLRTHGISLGSWSDEMKNWYRMTSDDFRIWKLERKDKRLTKKQEKATHHLRKLIIKKMINLRPFGTLNWSHTGAEWSTQFPVGQDYDDLVDEANEMIAIAVKTDILGKKGGWTTSELDNWGYGSLDDMVEQWRRAVGERAW